MRKTGEGRRGRREKGKKSEEEGRRIWTGGEGERVGSGRRETGGVEKKGRGEGERELE